MDQDAEFFVTTEDFTELVTSSAKKSLSISATGPVVRFWCGSKRRDSDDRIRETPTVHLH